MVRESEEGRKRISEQVVRKRHRIAAVRINILDPKFKRCSELGFASRRLSLIAIDGRLQAHGITSKLMQYEWQLAAINCKSIAMNGLLWSCMANKCSKGKQITIDCNQWRLSRL